MRSSGTLSLFSERPDSGQRPYTFALSVLAHIVVIGAVSLGLFLAPPPKVLPQRFTLMHLDLDSIAPPEIRRAAGGIMAPGSQAPGTSASAKDLKSSPAAKAMPQEAALNQIENVKPGPQTLVQPDILKPIELKEETPIPAVVIWTPKKVQVTKLVPPELKPPLMTEVKPSATAPNNEASLAPIPISSTDLSLKTQMMPASSTTPMVVHGPPAPVQQPPVTAAQNKVPPTPTAILSLTDTHTKEQKVAVPQVSETNSKQSSGALAVGKVGDSERTVASESTNKNGSPTSKAGTVASKTDGNGDNKATGSSATSTSSAAADNKTGSGDKKSGEVASKSGDSSGKPGNQGKSIGVANANGPTGPGAGKTEAKGDAGEGTHEGAGGDQAGYVRFLLPKEGRFGSVIVGASLSDKFPEVDDLWNGRMAYTAYVHVGLPKTWILQYQLSRAQQTPATSNITHLEAPWPYNIVRPNLPAGAINADALMIHGFVNKAGRFEELAVAFPPQFPDAQFVLSALQQWQFRPAAQNGEPERVEIILIIPEIVEE